MSNEKEQSVFVVGHKNPDSDSICSAIAYANLKSKVTGKSYQPRRAGQINSETAYVLDYFDMDEPHYLPDVRTQVKDIEIRLVEGVEKNISLKKAWDIMERDSLNTLPIVDSKKHLEGLITVADIVRSYMDINDSNILHKAHTSYNNILEVLDGELLTGEEDAILEAGKVLIAAANPDVMENYIKENDIVLLGNRYEAQLCALEMKAKCLIVCTGAPVSQNIIKMAQEQNSTLIKTDFDTFTASRLLNQSIPISYFMKKDNLVTFTKEDYIDDVKEVMTKVRHRDFPVLDSNNKFLGLISRRNLLEVTKKQVILVDHNEVSQAVDGLDEAEILEIIDHHRIGSIETLGPIYFRNQPLGCTGTIVYQMYKENGIEIDNKMAGLMCSAILSDTLVFRSPTCTAVDKAAAEELAEIAGIEIESYAKKMFAAGSNLSGKTEEEIFYQDFKKFNAGDTVFGVGQVSSMDEEELDALKARMLPYMEKTFENHGANMLFFMLTNILDESSELIYKGEGADKVVEKAFKSSEEGRTYLKGVVSRKKQIVPQIMGVLQNE